MEKDSLVVCGGLEVRVESHHLGDEGVALFFDLLAGAILPGVQPFALTVVDRLWRGRPGEGRGRQKTREDITGMLLYHRRPKRSPTANTKASFPKLPLTETR